MEERYQGRRDKWDKPINAHRHKTNPGSIIDLPLNPINTHRDKSNPGLIINFVL